MKGGGGVALYIINDIGLHSKLLSAKSFVTDDILECVTVELSVSKPMRKTVTISCIYRTPGSNIDMFIESVEKYSRTISQKQQCLYVGISISIC